MHICLVLRTIPYICLVLKKCIRSKMLICSNIWYWEQHHVSHRLYAHACYLEQHHVSHRLYAYVCYLEQHHVSHRLYAHVCYLEQHHGVDICLILKKHLGSRIVMY